LVVVVVDEALHEAVALLLLLLPRGAVGQEGRVEPYRRAIEIVAC
jgi:hypothetical protein